MADHHHQHREVHIDMTSSELAGDTATGRLGRTHNRSASWTFRSPNTADLSSLASLTSVIREFVPAAFTSEDPMSSSTAYERNNSNAMEYDSVRTYGHTTAASHTQHSRNSSTSNAMPYHNDVESGHRPPLDTPHPIVEELHPPETNDSVKWFEENMLLILVLIVRFSWMHRLGLVVLLGMLATYIHGNRSLKREISLKDRRSKLFLCWIMLFLSANIYFVYYVFREQQLENCLHFSAPFLPLDLWNVLWCICVTDFIIRFGVMVMKALVAATFTRILPTKRKGKYYMFLEYASQMYRSLIPAPLWFRYLSNYYQTGRLFAVFITAIYLMIKGSQVYGRMKQLYKASIAFSIDPNYGCNPSREEMMSVEGTCPICQEEMNDAIMLKACNHIFCETCIQLWFDRERTCPLCRSVIASDPKWRDGSTEGFVMLF